uniref:OmpA/MotB domain protein n=1 Tax=bacterium enrichment culture clone g13 TaxID=1091412 RepID=G4WWD5_9BACT|nr:OmpA/MotB domain protein [bacterium enrichment culture clone g13]
MKQELFAAHAASVSQATPIKSRYNLLAQVIGLTAAFTSTLAFAQNDEESASGFNFRAEPSHWYIGGNFGRTEESIDDGEIANSIIGGDLTFIDDKDSDRGYKFFVGYQFNHHFALEAGYADLGDFGVDVTRTPGTGTLTGDTNYKGYNLDAVATWPLTQHLSAFGRVGAFHYETEESFVGTESLAASLSRDDKDTGYKFGAGLEYSLTERLSARIEAERYRIEDMLGDHGSVNLYSIGLVYRFGDRTPPRQEDPVVAQQQDYCSKLDIHFEINRAEIPRAESERLNAASEFLQRYPNTKAVITGHTDSVGNDQANMQLSQRRADSVLQYLVGQQIDSSRISTVARGEADPVASNDTDSGKRDNRRINTTIDCVKDVAGLSLPETRITVAALVEFNANSVEVDEQYHADLEKAANYLRDNPNVTAHVEGHAADLTSTDKAQQISERRAANVVDYLVEKFSIERSRLTAEGFGKTHRVAYNTTEEGKQQNRRVNIVLSYPK